MVWETHSPGQGLTQSAIIITSSDIGEYLLAGCGKTIGAGRHHLGGSDKRNNHQENGSVRDLRTRFGRISSSSGDNLQGSFTETPFFRSLLELIGVVLGFR